MGRHFDRRGISSVFAALFLVGIVVSASVLLYMFTGGLFGTLASGNGQQTLELVTMEDYNAPVNGPLTITLRNVGAGSVDMSNAHYFLDGTRVATDGRCAVVLTVGETCTTTLTVTANLVAGIAYTLKIVSGNGGIFPYVVIYGSGNAQLSTVQGDSVWSATYQTQNLKAYWNEKVSGRQGQTCAVSLNVVEPPVPTSPGPYSEFFYKPSGPSTSGIPCQWAEHETLSSGLTDYVQQISVYVPSHFPNGSKLTLTDWQSFLTGHLCTSVVRGVCTGPNIQYSIDANPDRTLHLWIQGQGTFHSVTVAYPLDQWFTITVAVHLDPTGKPDSTITVSLNGVQFVNWKGAIPAGLSLWMFHDGLYVGPKQGSFSVYDTNEYLWNEASNNTSAT